MQTDLCCEGDMSIICCVVMKNPVFTRYASPQVFFRYHSVEGFLLDCFGDYEFVSLPVI